MIVSYQALCDSIFVERYRYLQKEEYAEMWFEGIRRLCLFGRSEGRTRGMPPLLPLPDVFEQQIF